MSQKCQSKTELGMSSCYVRFPAVNGHRSGQASGPKSAANRRTDQAYRFLHHGPVPVAMSRVRRPRSRSRQVDRDRRRRDPFDDVAMPDVSTTYRAAVVSPGAKPKGLTQTNISDQPLQPRIYGAIGWRVCKSLRIARLAAAAARCLSVCPLTIEPSEKIFSSRNSSNLASAYSAAAITQ
jgi:hypothetical protein